ncbi:glycosyltransferase family 2 protein [Acinetobacter junii]|uniref:glycosyltransferase family 2 protein n=1 Tax=Acinetobacter junii TaxID=40215 RepID=UPI00124C7CA3|nr:glycosyltransferase family 2 protein [Acinetobacter junii]
MIIKAVIVTFNPDENVIDLVYSLEKQGVGSIIVDNGSKEFDFSKIKKNIDYSLIKLGENLGIATAQNIGIEKTVAIGGEFILFFDQDSRISDDFVQNLLDDYELLCSKSIKVGALGPRFIDDRGDFYYNAVSVLKSGLRVKYNVSEIKEPFNSILIISSGSLINVDVIKKVGGMKDNYFIDYVDTEWCFRAESLGYKVYISSKAVMHHRIGDKVIKGKYFTLPVHSSFRRYFIIRNSIYMLKERYIPKPFVFHQILINLIHQILIIILLKSNKFNYIKSLYSGVTDGVKMLLFKFK